MCFVSGLHRLSSGLQYIEYQNCRGSKYLFPVRIVSKDSRSLPALMRLPRGDRAEGAGILRWGSEQGMQSTMTHNVPVPTYYSYYMLL